MPDTVVRCTGLALGSPGKPQKREEKFVPGGSLRVKLAFRPGHAALAARAGPSPCQRDATNGMQFTGCNLWGATYGMQRMSSKVGKPLRHPRVGIGLRRKPMGGREGREAGGRRGGWVERNLHPSKCPVQVAWGSAGLFGWGCNSSKNFLPDPPCLVENTKTSHPNMSCTYMACSVEFAPRGEQRPRCAAETGTRRRSQ